MRQVINVQQTQLTAGLERSIHQLINLTFQPYEHFPVFIFTRIKLPKNENAALSMYSVSQKHPRHF